MAIFASYPLSRKIASFDFFNWLVMVQTAGAGKIIFDISNPKHTKYTKESAIERFHSIIEPGPALAGLPYRLGKESGLDARHDRGLLPWWESNERHRLFKRLSSPKPPVECKYTVTLRNSWGAIERNSNRDAWCKFAEEIDAVLIEDWWDKPIHLHDRMALYAGAQMNFGVCNGPMHLLSLTEYPVSMWVNSERARKSLFKLNQAPDANYPWMLPNQSLVWMEDSLDNLRREFDRSLKKAA